MEDIFKETWFKLFPDEFDQYQKLVEMYSGEGRFYHNVDHINHGLKLINDIKFVLPAITQYQNSCQKVRTSFLSNLT